MQRTKIIVGEVALATDAGTATSISSATCVRLHNGAGTTAIVSMASTVGAADTVTFSMPADTVEFLEKTASYVVWADSALVKAAKVGFTA